MPKHLSKAEIVQKLPQALVDRLTLQFSPLECDGIFRGFAAERLPTIRLNPLAADPHVTLANLKTKGVQLRSVAGLPLVYEVCNQKEAYLLKLPEAESGGFLLQGISSCLPAFFLNPKAQETIWDMCAAPGSKTSQMAAMTQGKAKIFATEKDQIRFEKLKNTLTIQKCSNIEALCADAISIAEQFPAHFDAILLDAPCSAEGRINIWDRRSYGFWSEKNSLAQARLQRRLFQAAMVALKKNGRILYSTCTLAPAENIDLVESVLSDFSGQLRQIPLSSPIAGVKEIRGSLLALPNEKMEGFFIALFQKK